MLGGVGARCSGPQVLDSLDRRFLRVGGRGVGDGGVGDRGGKGFSCFLAGRGEEGLHALDKGSGKIGKMIAKVNVERVEGRTRGCNGSDGRIGHVGPLQ